MNPECFERLKYYYFFQNIVGKSQNHWAKIQSYLIKLQKILGINRLKYKSHTYQKGANWCSLNQEAVEYIITQKWIALREYRYTIACDEIFIHTLIWNSKFRDSVYKLEECNGNAMRYIDWNRGGPYVFEEKDFDELINANAMFARKFSWKKDKLIVKKLKTYLI